MIFVRVSDWRPAPKELRWLTDWFEHRGISARIRHSGGKFAVFREMEPEMAERLGWIEDVSYHVSFSQKMDRSLRVASGSWRSREIGRSRCKN